MSEKLKNSLMYFNENPRETPNQILEEIWEAIDDLGEAFDNQDLYNFYDLVRQRVQPIFAPDTMTIERRATVELVKQLKQKDEEISRLKELMDKK